MLKENSKAPAFSLPDQDGVKRSLKDFAGKKLVLFFYPRANTSGCTTEATDFRNIVQELESKNVAIIGVSRDKPEAQKKWAEKYELPFPLLSDPDHAIHDKYGAWGEKTMYGKKMEGVIRTTVVIGEDGKVIKIYPNVKAKGHAAKVLEGL